MINKESIKEVILNDGTIKFPYKENVNDWFSSVEIHIYRPYFEGGVNEAEVVIAPFYFRYPVSQMEEALDKFFEVTFGDSNIAFVFREAMENLELLDYDGDDEDTKKIENEIKRIRESKNVPSQAS